MGDIRSAVILAGGAGRRIGSEKAFLEFFGRSMVEWAVYRVSEVAEDVVVVARNEAQSRRLRDLGLDARLTCDRVFDYGPVAGLAAGMRSVRGEYALAVGCDQPFLNPDVLDRLFQLAEGLDAAVPVGENGVLETLHAVYRTDRMVEACESALSRGMRKILAPLEMLRVNRVPMDSLRPLDPRLLSFFNINTEEDLTEAMAEARRLWAGRQK